MSCKKQKKERTRQWYFADNLYCAEMKAEYEWRIKRYKEVYGDKAS